MSSAAGLEGALALKRAGRLEEAIIALEAVLGESSGTGTESAADALALAHLADIQLRRRRLTDAAAALERAEASAGTTAFTARLRGDLRYREQRWLPAATSYREAELLGDRGTWSLVQQARCHLHLRDVEAARGAASRALERDESSAPAWTLLGEIAQREGREDDALGLFERAHAADARDEYAYAKLIEARMLRLAPDERAREVEILLRGGGEGNRHLFGVLARLRSEEGDEQRAADSWRARRERHGDPYARKMEGYALRRAGDLDRAAGVLRACLLEDPEDLVLFRTYVHLERSRGAVDELRATLEQLVPLAGSRRGAVFGELRKLGPAG